MTNKKYVKRDNRIKDPVGPKDYSNVELYSNVPKRQAKLSKRKKKNILKKGPEKPESIVNCADGYQFFVGVDDKDSPKGVPYYVNNTFSHINPVSTGLFRVKASSKAVGCIKESKNLYNIPYIDINGRITMARLGTWKTTPFSILCSITSTIYHRLHSKFRKSYNSKRPWLDNLLFRVSFLTAVSSNNYALDRFSHVAKNNMSHARRTFNYFFSKFLSGENSRFCYFQMLQNIIWIKHRGKPISTAKIPDYMIDSKILPLGAMNKNRESMHLSILSKFAKKFATENEKDNLSDDQLIRYKYVDPLRRISIRDRNSS
jgi:hypothetical protein